MRIFLLLGLFFTCLSSSTQVDSLKNALQKNRTSKDSIGTVLQLVTNYDAIDPDSCIKYAQIGLHLSKEPLLKYRAYFLNMIGVSYGNKHEFKNSIKWYKSTLEELKRRDDDPLNIGMLNNNIGWSFTELRQHDSAMVYLLEAKKISDKVKEPYLTKLLNLNFGLLYEHLDKFDLAEKHYRLSLKISEQDGDLYNIALLNNNLAFVAQELGKYEQSIQNYRRSYALSVQNDFYYLACKAAQNVYTYYINKQMADSAQVWRGHAQNTLSKVNSDKLKTAQFICDAQWFLLIGNRKECLLNAERAYYLADSLNDIEFLQASTEILSDVMEREGNYAKSLTYLKLAELYEDSIYNEENSKLLAGLRSTYELNKRDLEIKNLSYQKKLKEKSNKLKDKQILTAKKENRMYFIGLISLVVLVGFIAYFLIHNIRTNKKIVSQNMLIEAQKEELSNKQTEIIDSINYAKRIQNAILPERSELNRVLKSGFVFYHPKDIVSGDFYWMEVLTGNEVLIAVADCTGHGVPGAMVSVVCNNALNRSVREFGLTTPGLILDKTKEIVVEEFAKNAENVKDGMDISLVKLNLTNHRAEWAGANNPLWIHRKGNLDMDIIKPNKQPIGVYHESSKFHTHRFELSPGDRIFLFSDGFQDQFGGKAQKKYKPQTLRYFLRDLKGVEMDKFEVKLLEEFNQWKGPLEQLDDVCIVGVEI